MQLAFQCITLPQGLGFIQPKQILQYELERDNRSGLFCRSLSHQPTVLTVNARPLRPYARRDIYHEARVYNHSCQLVCPPNMCNHLTVKSILVKKYVDSIPATECSLKAGHSMFSDIHWEPLCFGQPLQLFFTRRASPLVACARSIVP